MTVSQSSCGKVLAPQAVGSGHCCVTGQSSVMFDVAVRLRKHLLRGLITCSVSAVVGGRMSKSVI